MLAEKTLWAWADTHYTDREVVEVEHTAEPIGCPRCPAVVPAAVFIFENYIHYGERRCGHCLNHLGWEPKPENVGKRTGIRPGLRWRVLQAAGYRCAYCRRTKGQLEPGEFLHVDHKVPAAKGGTDDLANLVCACSTCKLGKDMGGV